MRMAFRVLVSAIAGIVVFFFASWTLLAALSFAIARHGPATATSVAALLAGAFCAAACARSVWRATARTAQGATPGLAMSMVRGALIVGTLGFAAGFFGPILLEPGANQGPLLGIFFTGPLGVIVGAIGGGVRWSMRRGRAG
jgi:hypothetical protein